MSLLRNSAPLWVIAWNLLMQLHRRSGYISKADTGIHDWLPACHFEKHIILRYNMSVVYKTYWDSSNGWRVALLFFIYPREGTRGTLMNHNCILVCQISIFQLPQSSRGKQQDHSMFQIFLSLRERSVTLTVSSHFRTSSFSICNICFQYVLLFLCFMKSKTVGVWEQLLPLLVILWGTIKRKITSGLLGKYLKMKKEFHQCFKFAAI